MRWRISLIALFSVHCAACGDERWRTWSRMSSGKVTVYSKPEDKLCRGNAAHIDFLAAELARLFGEPPLDHIDYIISNSREEVRKACFKDDPVGGCAFVEESRIWFVSDYDTVSAHEITHLIADQNANGVALTSEGLAYFVEDPRYVQKPGVDFLAHLDDRSYRMHRLAIGRLVELFGYKKVIAFHRKTDRSMGIEDFRTLFLDHFDLDFGAFENEIIDTGYTGGPMVAPCMVEQEVPIVPNVPYVRELDCNGDALGSEEAVYGVDVLQVPAGYYRIDNPNTQFLADCETGRSFWAAGTSFQKIPEARLTVRQGRVGSGPVSILFEEWEPEPACRIGDDVTPFDFRTSSREFSIEVPLDEVVAIPVQFADPSEIYTHGSGFELCDSACTCRNLNWNLEGPTTVEPQTLYWIIKPEGSSGTWIRVNPVK